ncbi:hypothetical protein E2P64_06040 [Candidatus Bathyarchaeota archaeon]|nr:hypothetical protein E2P64_06040 [Candidatus Bathyarchaeota archaeon]
MIPLKLVVEYAVLQGQSYDLGRDWSNFQRAIDGSTDQVKSRFEDAMNEKLRGKRIRARASRGYKQFEKDYEINVDGITIDDYYDNFVVVAHDRSGKKEKEYFLKPRAKIQIIGLSSTPNAEQPESPDKTPPVPKVVASPSVARLPGRTTIPVKEDTGMYDAYSIENIVDDISPWVKRMLKDPRIGVREFVKALGWMKTLSDGRTVAVYDLTLPKEHLGIMLTQPNLERILKTMSGRRGNIDTTFQLAAFTPSKESYKLRIKKIMKDLGPRDDGKDTFSLEDEEGAK